MNADWDTKLETYLEWPDLHLPPRLQFIKVLCGKCGREATDAHGVTRQYRTCLDVYAGGLCNGCKTITYVHFRVYEGFISVERQPGRWEDIHFRPTWDERLAHVFRGVLRGR